MRKLSILFLICLFTATFNSATAQFKTASDNAGNYSAWANTNNLGFGFANWDLWQSNSSGWFLGSSSSAGFGNIDTNSKAFGLWGNPSGENYANAQRVLSNWSDGAAFTIDLAIAYRNGNKGIDLFATGWDKVWNFSAVGDKYTAQANDLGWAYSQTSVFTLTATQSGSDIVINLVRGSDTYTTTIPGKTLYSFKLYCGSTSDGNALNNLFFNNLKVTYSDWSKVPADKKVEITETATLNANKSVSDLVINGGVTASVAEGKSLTVTGTAINNGTIKLLSDGTNGTGTLIGNVGGNAEVNQYLTLPIRTWYMSSPVLSASPVDMLRIKSYNESTNSWETATVPMVVGKGYSVTPNTGITNILFTGALNTGEKTIALTNAGSTTQAGFNAVGNPYPSYIDWKALATKTENQNILETGTMWYRTKIDATTYKYFTVDALGNVAPSGSTITAFIPPMQAFWVKTKTGGGTFYFEDNMRSHASTTPNLLKAPAAKNSELSLLRLQVSNGTNVDEAVIYSYANAENGYDFYDSQKMMNNDVAIPEIYTTLNSQPIVINVMNSLPLNTEIGLAFVPGDATSFSLKASEISNLPSDVSVILKDNATGTETDLTDGVTVYNFAPATTSGDRFSVILRRVSTAVESANSNAISVYSTKNGIQVTVNSTLNDNASVRVFNAVGQQLVNQHLTNRTTMVNGNFNPGVYVVKVSNGTAASATQKIVIK